MQIIHDYKTYQSDAKTSLTIGNFDGIHLGHKRILQDLVNTAKQSGTRSVVITFSPHPLEILLPEKAPRLITPSSEKLALIEQSNVDMLLVLVDPEDVRAALRLQEITPSFDELGELADSTSPPMDLFGKE